MCRGSWVSFGVVSFVVFFPVCVNRMEHLHSWLSNVKGYWTRNADDSLLHLEN